MIMNIPELGFGDLSARNLIFNTAICGVNFKKLSWAGFFEQIDIPGDGFIVFLPDGGS